MRTSAIISFAWLAVLACGTRIPAQSVPEAADPAAEAATTPEPETAPAPAAAPEANPGIWRVSLGFPVDHSGESTAARYPWGEARGGIGRFVYRSPESAFRMDAAVNDGGAWRLSLRALTSHGGRLEMRYRRSRRNFFDGAPMVLDQHGMSPAARAIYTRVIVPGVDGDGDWDPDALTDLAAVATSTRSRMDRDLLTVSFIQRLPRAGDLSIDLDWQRRVGSRPVSYLQSTNMQESPGWFPDGHPYGEIKAITAYQLPVDERETGVRIGYVQQTRHFRIGAHAGASRHAEDWDYLNVANPWGGDRMALTSSLGQDSDSARGEINLAGRFGRHTISLKSRVEETRADIAIRDFIPFDPLVSAPAGTRARTRRSSVSLAWRAYAGEWDFALEGSRRRKYRTDRPLDLPQYDHPLGGAAMGGNAPPPNMGLGRTPRPMNESVLTLQAGVTRYFHGAGSLSLTASRKDRDLAWRAVPRVREDAGAVDYLLTRGSGRLHIGVESARKRAADPLLNYYEVSFIGPDWMLMGEPAQALEFVPADLLNGRRLTYRVSGDYQFTPNWDLTAEAKFEREKFERVRVGLHSLRSRRFGLTLDGALTETWHWTLYGGHSRQDVEMTSSKAAGGIEPSDPYDPTHTLPDVLPNRLSMSDAGQRLSWTGERWQMALEGNWSRVEDDALVGVPLHLRTKGARFSMESKLGRGEEPEWSLGAQCDWRKITREEAGGDRVPGFTTALLDPYNLAPAPDIFAPLSGLGPQGWVAGVFVRWQSP